MKTKSKLGTLVAPNGSEIIGTDDTLSVTALFNGASRRPDGTYELEYTGKTDIDWESQETRTHLTTSERWFVAKDGSVWRESELILRIDEN